MELSFQPTTLIGFVLALARASAWLTFCPPFNSTLIPSRVRVGFSVALSFVLATRIGATVDPSITTPALVFALITQILAGLALGLFVLILFSALQAAGELMDLQVGFSLGGVIDPLSGNMAAPIGRLHQLLGITLLFAINGHVLLVHAFIESVRVAPLGKLDFTQLASSLASTLGVLFGAAIEIALPILAALFCAEVALGLLGKAAPQLNILVIGFALKTLIAFALLGATFVLLPESTTSLLGQALHAAARIFRG
jgi:flagellar biosynthesis protein FliR